VRLVADSSPASSWPSARPAV